jgi:hypothetical protein
VLDTVQQHADVAVVAVPVTNDTIPSKCELGKDVLKLLVGTMGR